MQIINIDNNYVAMEESIIALGNFDGVHLAHKKLLSKLVEQSKIKNIKSSIFIFENHTKNIVNHKKQRLLSSNEQKLKILKDLGIDIVYKMKFDERVMQTSPEDFIKRILIGNLKVKAIVVGYDYRFGYKAKGDIGLLKKTSLKEQLELFVVDKVVYKGYTVSSTLIRNMIEDGNIKLANELLGYEYSIMGKVIKGKNLGKKMGYPTANLEPLCNYTIPKFGVYNSKVNIDNKKYTAATNVGKNPSVENYGLRIEAHILDFNEDIYGKLVELDLIDFIRVEEKFNSINELFAQIEKDVELIKATVYK